MSVTIEQRVEYVVRKLELWAGNVEANAQHSRDNMAFEQAGRLTSQAASYRELAATLRGEDDEYIARTLSMLSA